MIHPRLAEAAVQPRSHTSTARLPRSVDPIFRALRAGTLGRLPRPLWLMRETHRAHAQGRDLLVFDPKPPAER